MAKAENACGAEQFGGQTSVQVCTKLPTFKH